MTPRFQMTKQQHTTRLFSLLSFHFLSYSRAGEELFGVVSDYVCHLVRQLYKDCI